MLHHGSSCLPAWTVDGCIMRRGIISSCQSGATSEIVKRFWSRVLTRVSSTIASIRPLPFLSPLMSCVHQYFEEKNAQEMSKDGGGMEKIA